MNRLDDLMREEISSNGSGLDLDSIIKGTHKRIKRRRNTRRVLYSSPAAAAVLALVFFFAAPSGDNGLLPGDELILAGLEYSSTIVVDEVQDEIYETEIIEAGIDYVTDIHAVAYEDELGDLLTEEDIEAFYSYLKEV